MIKTKKSSLPGSRGRFALRENVTYEVRDASGKVKQLFNENWFGKFLLKFGIKIPQISIFGFWGDQKIISNLTTTAGKAGVASRINGDGAEAVFTYIALGTGTTAAAITDTTLETELVSGGASRAAATASRVTTDTANDTARLVKTFSITATLAITESGVLNAAAAGVLLARQVFSAINVANGDSLQITWDFDVD